jgi:nucleoside-diphosphate-sugar epimerase
MVTTQGKVFVAGCGFAGLATARLLQARGWDVVGCTHSEESARALSGEAFPVVACDISDRLAVEGEDSLRGCSVVIHCASSGKGGAEAYERVYFNGARNFMEVVPGARLIFTSSTSVYAQVDGGWVDEESPAEPGRETGRWLRATEQLVLGGGGVSARLAGIYGPGRSVLLRKFFRGEAVLEGDGARWINQVHRDDIAMGLVFLAEAGLSGVYNISDDKPLAQRELYVWLAERFGRALPPSGPVDMGRKRGWTHKRVSNRKLRSLGWSPQYPSFVEAVERDRELLAALEGGEGAAGGEE